MNEDQVLKLLKNELQNLIDIRRRYQVHGKTLDFYSNIEVLHLKDFSQHHLEVNRATGQVISDKEISAEDLEKIKVQVAANRKTLLLEEQRTIRKIQALTQALSPELDLIETWEIPQ